LKYLWTTRTTTILRNAVLGPTGLKATLWNDYQWTTRTTTFLRNAIMGPTGSKATLLNKYCPTLQWLLSLQRS
jgi:hypothetical protein